MKTALAILVFNLTTYVFSLKYNNAKDVRVTYIINTIVYVILLLIIETLKK